MSSRDKPRPRGLMRAWLRAAPRAAAVLAALAACSGPLAVAAAEEGGGLAGAFADPEPGGRGAALAGALAPLVDDPSAVYWNPARLLQVPATALTVGYADLFSLGLVQQSALFLAFPRYERAVTWERGHIRPRAQRPTLAYGLGLSATRVDLDPQSYSEYDLALSLARSGWAGVDFGCTGHLLMVRSDVDQVGANGYAFDLALHRAMGARLDGALILRSLFSSLSWENETTNALSPRLQVALGIRPRDDLRIPLAATLDLDREDLILACLGAEWWPVGDALALRAGIRWRDDGETRVHGAAGMGLHWKAVAFDYGFAAGRAELGDTHRLSLHIRF